MVLLKFSTGQPNGLFLLVSERPRLSRKVARLIDTFDRYNECAFDCDRARSAYDVCMKAWRLVFAAAIACGGAQDAKPHEPDQTAQSDGSAASVSAVSQNDASVTNAQTDGAVAQADAASLSAPEQDDVDKSVSVCGDEAIPIEKRVRKKVKECWSAAASRNPALDGHVRVTFVIDPQGKIQKTTIAQEKTLGADTTACIKAAINAYKLDGTKCMGKTVGFEEAFGRAARD